MRHDEGSTLPLVAGLLALVLGAACAIVDVSSLYIERTRLATIADSTARVAAESFTLDDVSITTDGATILLASGRVQRAAQEYLAATQLAGVRLVTATTPDQRTAVVTVESQWRPPVPVPFVPDTIDVTVTGSARVATNE